ncbi:MAG: PEP-utilizing enzyme [Anaerolineae bacterium]|nr:PEP-utilizing enzyme [Anaerolineae bacterium]
MHSFLLPLDSPGATLADAGGKGLNLAKLARAGFPAPGGYIIATAAYRAYVAENRLAGWLSATVGTTKVDDPAALEATSQAIRARFAAGVLPAGLTDAVVAAYDALGRPAVAVRSSATAEDLPDMSFAGQQDTFLNVVGADALLAAVVACWSSLWTARAIAYRARNGIAHDEVALAVVVQAMVQSEAAGVLFTANPLTGKRGEAIIDATLGLGEALVGGHVEPDNYAVDTGAGHIIRKTLGAKAVAIRGQAGGGTLTTHEAAADRQALPDAAILALARLGAQVEAQLYPGQPQDIEWAWADGKLFLLQARAITSLFPLPDESRTPRTPLQVLFSLNHVQGMLDPFTPLGQDAIRLVLVAFFRAFGYRYNLDNQRELVVAGERVYINITPAVRHPTFRRVVIGALGFVEPSAQQIMRGLSDDPQFGPIGASLGFREGLRLLRLFLPLLRVAAGALLRPDARRTSVWQMTESALAELEQQFLAATSLSERLMLWQRGLDFVTHTAFPRLFPVVVAGMGSFFQLRRLVAGELGSDRLALEAARGLPHNVTTEMDLALWDVAQRLQREVDPAARAHFAAAAPSDLAAEYLAGTLPPVAQSALAGFLARYGFRGLAEIDLGRPRWREAPAQIMQIVQNYARITDPDQAPDVVFSRGAAAAEAAIAQIATEIHHPIKRRLARFFASRMRALAGLREFPKFMLIRIMSLIRESMRTSGRELAEAGVLDCADDIFFLHYPQLQALARGEHDDWRGWVARNRRAYARELLRKQAPRILLSDGTAFYEGVGADSVEQAGMLIGSPVSPGVIEGVVHVVFDPRTAQLAPGEILVCPGTDPAWTPLFLSAGGLVMEVGGLMTHGSVVAREYGIPAVVGVHEATQRLKTGQRVRVDGSAGRVSVL